ncbi:hypothetical protein B0T26DRAFT_671389 [Lasiosphaeria miniovina]|uniref:Uncharacterized protein n=1 Tax=Lasiosphaeria miniovina TaxID=1954250 RepID=A0AA40EEA0_9PEZI|nr:uncharacterized protein B0T26DRAFT_671389 [Lasiosphaeria miniovina]KAK0735217.1 hypothetical protein B0T26DRAFT_671389 [Lasiosphaeria miniovina]
MALRLAAAVYAGGFFAGAQLDTSPWMWATVVVTETVWTMCAAEETTTIVEQGPVSTSIVLANAVLSDITIQPASSPAWCYSLPTPLSALDSIALSVDRASPTAPSTASVADEDAVFFYVGDNATAPEYVGALVDGSPFLLDISSNASAAGHVALVSSATGETLVFDAAGMHRFAPGCVAVSSVLVAGFMEQMVDIVSQMPVAQSNVFGQDSVAVAQKVARSKSAPKMAETNFTVVVEVDDIIDALLREPHVFFGPSECAFLSRDDKAGGDWTVLSWTCQFPGANSGEKACEAAFHSWLEPDGTIATSTIIARTTVAATTVVELSPQCKPISNGHDLFLCLPQFVRAAGAPLTDLLPGIDAQLRRGLGWLAHAAQAAVVDAAEVGGKALCRVLHAADEYPVLFSDPGIAAAHTIAMYVSPPVPTIVETLASRTTRVTREPPRAVIPAVTAFPNVTVPSFLPTAAGILTGIIGGFGSGLSRIP